VSSGVGRRDAREREKEMLPLAMSQSNQYIVLSVIVPSALALSASLDTDNNSSNNNSSNNNNNESGNRWVLGYLQLCDSDSQKMLSGAQVLSQVALGSAFYFRPTTVSAQRVDIKKCP